MVIKMMDVNYGEAIYLINEEHSLLVDCGSKFERKGKTAADAVKSLLCNNHSSALITHLDEDHYNGFAELAGEVKFNYLYLPSYFYKSKEGLFSFDEYLTSIIKNWTYWRILKQTTKLDTFHRFIMSIPRLVDDFEHVVCLGMGNAPVFGNKTIRILWPPYSYVSERPVYSEEAEILLTSKIKNLDSVKNAVNNYIEALAEIRGSFSYQGEYPDKYEQGDNRRQDQRDITRGDRVLHKDAFEGNDGSVPANQYERYVVPERFSQKQIVSKTKYFKPELFEELDAAYQKICDFSVRTNVDYEIMRQMSSINSKQINCMNDCSTVFEYGKELLMLGDVGTNVFDRYIVPNLANEYKVVKISHHGTKAYYSQLLPNAEKYLISNSGSSYIRWGIFDLYPDRYPNQIVCTNTNPDRCGIVNRCIGCKVGQEKGDCILDTAII